MLKVITVFLMVAVLLSGCAAPGGAGARAVATPLPTKQAAEKAQVVPSSTPAPKVVQTAQPTPKPTAGGEASEPDPSTRAMEKGELVALVDGLVSLDSSAFAAGSVHYYNTKLAGGKTVYFFVARDQNGTYRAAANACQVCFAAKLGFRHEGELMICNACGNRYPLVKVATQKGGCNPAPISPNLEARNGKLVIAQAALEQISGLF